MDYSNQIKTIKETSNKVQPYKVTILTGTNGSGKSLVRKLVGFYIADKVGVDKEKPIPASTSMQTRTELRSDLGAMSSIMHDDPTNPTSLETFHLIKKLLKICSADNRRYIVIDEPEIGMGEELVVALVEFLNGLEEKEFQKNSNFYSLLLGKQVLFHRLKISGQGLMANLQKSIDIN